MTQLIRDESYPAHSEIFPHRGLTDVRTSLEDLELPAHQYFVIGGANLVLRGITETTPDVDLLIAEGLFQRLVLREDAQLKLAPASARKMGATNSSVVIKGARTGMPVSATAWLGDGYYPMGFDTHYEKVETVYGIPCLELDCVLESKLALQRPNDLRHIEQIAAFTGRIIELPHPSVVKPLLRSE